MSQSDVTENIVGTVISYECELGFFMAAQGPEVIQRMFRL